jgi:alpha-glucosidase
MLALAAGLACASHAQVVGETLAPRAVRYFADAAARDAAHPSYALEKPLMGQGPVPADFPVKVEFSAADNRQVATITIDPETSLYGTGEAAGPLLRNGRWIETWNTDAYGYGDEAKSLYQSHPWVLGVRPDGTAFGVLADTTYRCRIDTAATRSDQIVFSAVGPAFPVIVIDRKTPQEVLQVLADLTGKMPMPPQWAIGYHQCRYSYFPEARVRQIAKEFRDRQIPCDILWFDIDYMEGFRVFTFDRGHFPDPGKLNADLLSQGFKSVWMIDPGLKSRQEPSPNDPPPEKRAAEPEALKRARADEIASYNALHKSGLDIGAYVRKADGTVFEGDVWPGACHFPDYTQPAVRQWWAGLYKDFMAHGVGGVWNDMNEPAVFNVQSKTMPEDNVHLGDPDMIKPNGAKQGPEEARGTHARYHNVYGMEMIRGTREGIAAVNPDKRPFVLSRANFIGGQRYGATWTGDNTATWYHLEVSIPMALNLGLSGQPFIGPDIGGFAGNGPSGEAGGQMFARWMGYGAMLPFARAHTAKDNIDKEPWSFGPKVEETCRLALQRRYRLLPYFYSLFREASVSGLPVMRPTFFADPADPALRSEDDSFLLGSDLLVVAQVVPDRTRAVAMPRGDWRELAFEVPAGGRNTTRGLDNQDLDLPRLFVRPGAIIPTGPVVEYVGQKPLDHVTLVVHLGADGTATGTLYEDAGDGFGYQKGEYLLTTYRAVSTGDGVEVSVSSSEGKLARPNRQMTVRLLGPAGSELKASGKDGQTIRVSTRPEK